MRKKILDMAWLLLFLMSLTVISNIQGEKGLPETVDKEVAGTEASESSFTPESDEKTVITKNEIIRVMQPETELPEESGIEPETELPEESGIEPETELPEESSIEPETEIPQEGGNRWNITLTQEETDLLARIVWLEAQQCGQIHLYQ